MHFKLYWLDIEWNVVLETLVELFKLELLKTTNLKPKKLKLESVAKDPIQSSYCSIGYKWLFHIHSLTTTILELISTIKLHIILADISWQIMRTLNDWIGRL